MVHKFWSILFGIVALLGVALFVIAAVVPGWWLPRNVSSFGGSVDNLFYLILAITAFFYVLTESILVYNIWKFGGAEPGRKALFIHGNHRLEMIWTIVPAGILVMISLLQIGTWEEIKYQKNFPQADASVCQMVVVARQWEWRVRYPSPAEYRRWETDPRAAQAWYRLAHYPYEDYGQFDDVHDVNAIHIWKLDEQNQGKALVHLKTRDVLHSFFLPVLRLKQDAVPGKSIPVWFDAIEYNCARKGEEWVDGYNPKTGQWGDNDYVWDLACAEFCGPRHSMMKGRLYVHKDRADFMAWLEHQQRLQNQRTVPMKEVNAE